MSTTNRTRAFAVFTVAALLLAACGDDAATTETEAPAETTAAPEETTAPADTEAPVETSAAEPPTGEPVKIGILTSITSNFAPWGLQVRDGAQLAVDEINAAGGAGGRPLELVIEDDQNSPEEAVPAYERLVEEGVVAVGGIISSSVGGATAPLAESNQIPTFLVKSGDQTILTPDSRFTFRTCLPAAPTVAGPIIEYAAGERAHEDRGDRRRLPVGSRLPVVDRDRGRGRRRHRAPARGRSGARAGLHDVPRARSTSSGPISSWPPVIRPEAAQSSPSRTTSA